MVDRVTPDEVRQVVKLSVAAVSDLDLTEQIGVAHRLTDDLLSTKGLSDDRLKDIERYLSAHFAALFDKEVMSADKKVGGAQTEYYLANAMGKYLDLTVWGQMARLLDISGTLAAIGSDDAEVASRKARFIQSLWLSSLEGR